MEKYPRRAVGPPVRDRFLEGSPALGSAVSEPWTIAGPLEHRQGGLQSPDPVRTDSVAAQLLGPQAPAESGSHDCSGHREGPDFEGQYPEMTTTLDVEPEFRESLSAAGLATFRGFMDVVAGPAASEHRLRSTAPLDLQINGSPKRFFLKRNYRIPPRHAITPLLRLQPGFSQPRREWDVLGELAAAGIPAMRRGARG